MSRHRGSASSASTYASHSRSMLATDKLTHFVLVFAAIIYVLKDGPSLADNEVSLSFRRCTLSCWLRHIPKLTRSADTVVTGSRIIKAAAVYIGGVFGVLKSGDFAQGVSQIRRSLVSLKVCAPPGHQDRLTVSYTTLAACAESTMSTSAIITAFPASPSRHLPLSRLPRELRQSLNS